MNWRERGGRVGEGGRMERPRVGREEEEQREGGREKEKEEQG